MGTLCYRWKAAKAHASRSGKPIKGIVLHSACGASVEGDIATLTGTGVSAHWYVERDGTLWHLVQDGQKANHNHPANRGWANTETIGIEQEHRDGVDDWPLPQVKAVARLVAFLRQKHGDLPLKGHAEVCGRKGRKVDPVDYPWETLKREYALVCNEIWQAVRVV